MPNFDVASESYYRGRLDTTYDRIKSSLMEKIKADDPSTISIGLDGWSKHHHGYLGIDAHYLDENWDRVTFNLACTPFTERHTAEHIYGKLESELQDWLILNRTGLCLRDNAANMVAAFHVPDSVLKSVGCLNHSLQLVIKAELFSLLSVKNVIEKCRTLAGHANMSDQFYTEFYSQQEKQLGITNRQSLKQDVPTR